MENFHIAERNIVVKNNNLDISCVVTWFNHFDATLLGKLLCYATILGENESNICIKLKINLFKVLTK